MDKDQLIARATELRALLEAGKPEGMSQQQWDLITTEYHFVVAQIQAIEPS